MLKHHYEQHFNCYLLIEQYRANTDETTSDWKTAQTIAEQILTTYNNVDNVHAHPSLKSMHVQFPPLILQCISDSLIEQNIYSLHDALFEISDILYNQILLELYFKFQLTTEFEQVKQLLQINNTEMVQSTSSMSQPTSGTRSREPSSSHRRTSSQDSSRRSSIESKQPIQNQSEPESV
jgi:hypothetical protein